MRRYPVITYRVTVREALIWLRSCRWSRAIFGASYLGVIWFTIRPCVCSGIVFRKCCWSCLWFTRVWLHSHRLCMVSGDSSTEAWSTKETDFPSLVSWVHQPSRGRQTLQGTQLLYCPQAKVVSPTPHYLEGLTRREADGGWIPPFKPKWTRSMGISCDAVCKLLLVVCESSALRGRAALRFWKVPCFHLRWFHFVSRELRHWGSWAMTAYFKQCLKVWQLEWSELIQLKERHLRTTNVLISTLARIVGTASVRQLCKHPALV